MLARRKELRNKPTETEKLLWERLRRSQLGTKFIRQYSIDNYVVDFYCPEKHLIVELLGSVHSSPQAKIYDDHRRKYLRAFSMTIVEFWNDEVEKEMELVLGKIRDYLGR